VTLSAGPAYTDAAAQATAAALARAAAAPPPSTVAAAPRFAEPRPAETTSPMILEPSLLSLASQAIPASPPADPLTEAAAAGAVAEEPPPAVPADIDAPPPPTGGQPLGNLAPDVVERLSGLPGDISVATIDLRRNLAFTHQPDLYYDLASVSKVPLMLTVLRESEREERALSPREQSLLEMMIHSSNNEAAIALWEAVADGASALLFDSDVWPDILVPRGWGLWTGNAYGVARLFREIVAGDSLSPDVRDDAMHLLDGVVQWQRWGISAGLPDDGARVALKNGWYPTKGGWLVHSAGYVLDVGGRPDYVLVILSAGNPTFADGVVLIEEIAAGIHAALRPAVVSAGLREPTR
jgi:hypothetical protein